MSGGVSLCPMKHGSMLIHTLPTLHQPGSDWTQVWDPEKAIEAASLERAHEVRQHFGLGDDRDLAYAFEAHNDATSAGVHALAEQWVRARAKANAQ